MIAPRITDHRPFTALMVSLVALAWVALIAWGASPYRRYMGHQEIGELGGRVSGAYAAIALVFVVAWVLMTIAMMLPTALPLLLLFQRLVTPRRNSAVLTGAVILGYLVVWSLFGVAAHLGDLMIHTGVAHSYWLRERTWMISTATLGVAGAYQFTPLKYLCLERCRSPYSFIQGHWHGVTPKLDALRLGLHHGVYCVGCCWSLMLLMFTFGIGNLAWMLALGAVMATEKNLPWGRKLSTPLGVLLLSVTLGLVIAHGGLGVACAHSEGSCGG